MPVLRAFRDAPLWLRATVIAGGAVALFFLLLAAFPWGLLAGRGGGALSLMLGRPASFGSARRLDRFSLHPVLELADVRIAKPVWAGSGDLLVVRRAIVRFRALPLLLGRFRPISLDLTGASFDLYRDAAGREDWEGEHKRGGSPPSIRRLTLSDGHIRLTDVKRHMVVAGPIAVDGDGLRIDGTGTHRGLPLTLHVRGGPIDLSAADRRYPVRLRLRSPLVAFAAAASLDGPLNLRNYDATLHAVGRDLIYLDDVIQAGLFASQPFRLTASVRHDAPVWKVARLEGGIGRSRFVARGRVDESGGRVRLDADVTAAQIDFDDLASDAQHATAAARARRIGKRLLPDTDLDLGNLARLDGTLRLDAARLLTAGGSPFRSLRATVTLDHRRFTVFPLDIGLPHGRFAGRMTVDDRNGRPHLAIDLRMRGARIEDGLIPDGALRGPLAAHIVLAGDGRHFGEALGGGAGRVAFAGGAGSIRRDWAVFAGGDVFRSVGALIGAGSARAPMRCLIADFTARNGRLSPRTLVLDTDIARADGAGVVDLADETIDLKLTGRARHPGLLQSTAPIRLFGTLADPRADVRPPRAEGRDRIGAFRRIGFFLKGMKTRGDAGRAVPAADVPCAALAGAVLR